MKEFTGIVLGGPWDGRVLSWMSPHYRVVLQSSLAEVLSPKKEPSAPEPVPIEAFDYEHFNYLDHKFWLPRAVLNGEAFDYHTYSHPMEFVITKLIAGYNPGAK